MMITEKFKAEIYELEKIRPKKFLLDSIYFGLAAIFLSGLLYLEYYSRQPDHENLVSYSAIVFGSIALMMLVALKFKAFEKNYNSLWHEKIISKVFPDCTWEEIRVGKQTINLLCLRVPGKKIWNENGYWHRKEYQINVKPILTIVAFILVLGLWGISYFPEPENVEFRTVFIVGLLGSSLVMILPLWLISGKNNSELEKDPQYRKFPVLDKGKKFGAFEIYSIHQDEAGTTIKLITSGEIIPVSRKSFTKESTYRSWNELRLKLETFKSKLPPVA